MRSVAEPPRDLRHTPFGQADLPNARVRAGKLLRCRPAEIAFLPDATTGLNAAIRGLLFEGATAITDNRPHNAVTRTLRALPGVDWSILPLYSAEEAVDLRVIDDVPSDLALVCLTHVSNVTGAVYPMGEVIAAFRRRCPDAAILVDAAQSAGVIELQELSGADFVVLSGHKHLHSVSGAAILVARRKIPPLLYGGTGVDSKNLLVVSDDSNFPEVGTPNIAAVMALVAALDEWSAGAGAIRSTVQDRRSQLLHAVRDIPLLRPLDFSGHAYTGILSMAVGRGAPESEWVPFLRHNGLIARGGLHCAPVQHEQLGLLHAGTLRLSASRYTTEDEIEAAAELLRQCATMLLAGEAAVNGSAPTAADRSAIRIRAAISSHRPCADLEDAVEVSGHLTADTHPDIERALKADRWLLLNPQGVARVYLKQRAMMFVDAEGAFTLTRVADVHEAHQLLTSAGVAVTMNGIEQ